MDNTPTSPRAPIKPTKRHHVFAYDYHECCDYLQTRDGYDERDYAGKYRGHPNAPYQDFWPFVLDKARPEGCPILPNPSAFVMEESWGDGAAPWQQVILAKYLEAFGEQGEDGQRFVDFYVGW